MGTHYAAYKRMQDSKVKSVAQNNTREELEEMKQNEIDVATRDARDKLAALDANIAANVPVIARLHRKVSPPPPSPS